MGVGSNKTKCFGEFSALGPYSIESRTEGASLVCCAGYVVGPALIMALQYRWSHDGRHLGNRRILYECLKVPRPLRWTSKQLSVDIEIRRQRQGLSQSSATCRPVHCIYLTSRLTRITISHRWRQPPISVFLFFSNWWKHETCHIVWNISTFHNLLWFLSSFFTAWCNALHRVQTVLLKGVSMVSATLQDCVKIDEDVEILLVPWW